MAAINLTIEGLDQLTRMVAVLSPATFDKAIAGGVSYASKSVPPAVAKGIRADYNLTAARIKQDISGVQFAPDRQSATIRFSRRPPTLTQYGARPGTRSTGQRGLGRGRGWTAPTKPGKPVTATVLRSQGRKPVRGAFIATGNNANRIVLRRGPGRQQLSSVYGPSIGSIFLGKSQIAQQLQSDVKARINEQFQKGFERSISAAARGFGR